jgi:hypothetical protein
MELPPGEQKEYFFNFTGLRKGRRGSKTCKELTKYLC